MNRLEPRERYLRDPLFRTVVDTLQALLHNAEMTPTELREAAVLAAILYEERSIRAYRLSDGPLIGETK